MAQSIACPLCSQPGFPDVNSLWLTLIRATTRQLACPVCQEVLCGLDKLTIHLVSHSLHDQLVQACAASNLLSPPTSLTKNTDSHSLVSFPSEEVVQNVQNGNNQSSPVASYVLVNFPPVANISLRNPHQANNAGKVGIHIPENKQSVPELDPQELRFPALGDLKLNDSASAKNDSHVGIKHSADNGVNDLLKHVTLPQSNQYDLSNQETRPFLSENTVMMDPNSSSQCGIQNPRKISDSSNLKLSEPSPIKPRSSSTIPSIAENLNSKTSVSCGVCCLTFEDDYIATLHRQLIHNLSPRDDNQYQIYPKSNERNTSKSCRPKRGNAANQSRDEVNLLHRFPCHVCNKVFRMRGSLMVHLRVAHSPMGTSGLALQLGSSCTSSSFQSGDVTCKLPLETLSLKETKTTFASREDTQKTVDLETMVHDHKPINLTDTNHLNSPAVLKSGNEQVSTISKLVSENEMCSSKRPISTISPSLSPIQSPTDQSSSTDMIGMIFPCSLCNKTFSKVQNTSIICSYKGRAPSEALLTQHLKSHESKQWECDVCLKSFTTKYFLKKHKRLHTGEMPYTCGICNKSFTFQQSYHKHLLYHSDEKPHSCNECGRAFKELSTLHNHQRIHTGEKPWACETCGKCFRQRVSYLVHRRIHTGAMPYRCTVCLKSFRYKVSQRTHKCIALPTAEVTVEPGDFLTHSIQSTKEEVESCCAQSYPPAAIPFKDSQVVVRNHLQQMRVKQEHQRQNVANHLVQTGERLVNHTSIRHDGDDLTHVSRRIALKQQSSVHQPSADSSLMCTSSQSKDFVEFQCTQPPANDDVLKDASSNLKLVSEIHVNSMPLESHECVNSSSPSSSADFNIDLLQDILSMVMSPSSDSEQSPSAQMRHLSLSGPNDDDLESGLALRQLLYGTCDSESTP